MRRRVVICVLIVVCLAGTRPAQASPAVHLRNMEFQAPTGWSVEQAPDSATLKSADEKVTVVVTPNGLVDAGNVDTMVKAGPILPFFLPKLLGAVESGARPEQGFRAGTFEMSTFAGPSYVMRLIYILTDVGTFMVVSKATKDRGNDGVEAANSVLRTFKVSAAARAAAAQARREAAAEEARQRKAAADEAARQAAFAAQVQQRVAGRYGASFGPYDDKTFVTYWVCSNGRYLVARRNYLITSGPVYNSAGSSGDVSEAGAWTVGQDASGMFISFAPTGRQPHAHYLSVTGGEDGNPRIQGLRLPNGFFTREDDSGCRQGM